MAYLHGNLSVERAWLGGYCGVAGRFPVIGRGSVTVLERTVQKDLAVMKKKWLKKTKVQKV